MRPKHVVGESVVVQGARRRKTVRETLLIVCHRHVVGESTICAINEHVIRDTMVMPSSWPVAQAAAHGM